MLFSNEIDILQKDKKEYREIEKKIIEKEFDSNKNDWIGKINLNSSLSKERDFTENESDDMARSVGLSYSQSIFESGGIEYSIQYAKEQLKSDMLAWENQNIALIQAIYETLLSIEKLKLQIEQSDYSLKNKNIELILKKIQYEAGKVDIIDLNNAIMSKNNQQKENISLKNSLKDKEYELSKYTTLKSNEIKLIDFKIVDKEKFKGTTFPFGISWNITPTQATELLGQYYDYDKGSIDDTYYWRKGEIVIMLSFTDNCLVWITYRVLIDSDLKYFN
jgi:hypothetical protein